ncbi:hypothetical protein ACN4EG_23695 [Alkalinema pantanalense CENA528]|uniref:hypothetical protein n=1 Tax=Alkalinema pantanalense TaxID=1620705 RepID=UPI003D6E0B41
MSLEQTGLEQTGLEQTGLEQTSFYTASLCLGSFATVIPDAIPRRDHALSNYIPLGANS